MEQTLKQPAEQAAFTREELMRRLEEHRRKKKEYRKKCTTVLRNVRERM